MQQSMLWWKVLFHEMGPPATKHSDPPLDSRAHRRSQSLVSLFNKLVETSNTLLLLEIGAHNADVSIEFVQANKLRQAFAYEASPTIYNKTVERNIPKQVNYINEAVGSSSGQLIFYEPLSGGYKSQWGSINKRKDFEEFQSINVNAITLHTAIVRAVNSSNIDSKIALWIDVEGATYDVLVGSDKLVQENISVVFAELNDTQAYESSATSIKVIDYMLNAGFVPIARDNEWQDAWNIVFIHESLVPSLQEIILPWLAEEARLISKGL